VLGDTVDSGTYPAIRGSDTDRNYYWDAFMSGNNLTPNGIPLGWSTWDEMERNSDSDPGWHYVELNNYTGGSERN
jgi:hypothetical protein